ncbi:ATP-binding protein [Paraburkholderia tropica]|uniref:ATP-binding protein n=1 Tax=Paraburkholderia tropica TaxID=92647 RepID=UPI002AB0E324|nr:ATP-binding protein [Paraburkholderia tropica]
MFQVDTVSSPRGELKFSRLRNGQNKISIITGPNGSGKTELLATLGRRFSSPPVGGLGRGVSIKWRKNGIAYSSTESGSKSLPSRVIAQTFSPFSRFASPRDTPLSLTKIYAESAEQESNYRCVGIHRHTRYISGKLSKQVLERGIYQLTEAPMHTRALGKVIRALGFRERIDFRYRGLQTANELFKAFYHGQLEAYLTDMSEPWKRNELSKEARRTGVAALTPLLQSVLGLLGEYPDRGVFEFTFDFEAGKASEDFARMQALVLLRRLDAMRLERCSFSPIDGATSIDLAEASSGQQQMLCSMFGLFSELRDNSIVLIDEPELSLHPTWQMDFLHRLGSVLEQFSGCHVILATHSPLIAQSALINGIEVLRMGPPNDVKTAGPIYQQDADTSVEGTLLDVFGTPISGSVYLANEIFKLVASAEAGNSTTRDADLFRLRQLEVLYANAGTAASRQGDLEIIQKALRLVADVGNENYGL